MKQYIGINSFSYIINKIKEIFAPVNHLHDSSDIQNLDDAITDVLGNYGEIPDGYTRCSYIESNGTQYIQTNVVPNQDTRVIIDFEVTDGTTPLPIFGSRVDQNTNAFGLWVENKEENAESVHVCPQYGSVKYTEYHILMNPKQRLFIDMYSTGANVNGNISSWERTEFSTESRLTIFSMCSSNIADPRRAIGKLRSCRIYENGMLTLFLIPVITATGEAGMFDKVNGDFYGNSGEGVFVAG